MKRLITIIILSIALLSFGVFELIYVDKTIDSLKSQILRIDEKLQLTKDLSDESIYEDVIKLKKDWDKKEYALCYIISHKDLSSVTEAIMKLESSIILDNYDDAFNEVKTLESFAYKSKHMLGFNINNVF